MKSNSEKNLKFDLCKDYDGSIHRLTEINKKLENKPFFISIPTFMLFFFFGQSESKYETDIFIFFVILSISLFLYFKFKYKSKIQSNKECIERWIKEKDIQTSYVSFLYELETDYEKRTNNFFTDTIQKN